MSDMTAVDFETSEIRQELVRRGTMGWPHWLVITASIILTIVAWYISHNQVILKNEEQFNRQADQVTELVEERMQLYENELWGGVAFIDAIGGAVSYRQWLSYSNSLDIQKAYPGANGLGVIYNLQPDAVPAFLRGQRFDRPDFAIHPKHENNEFWPITYIEPAGPNAKAIGLDMAFETNRYTAVKKARDTGVVQLTGPIKLVQDAKQTPGFLLYAPFYKNGEKPDSVEGRRDNIVGVTYAPFIMSKLMLGTLASPDREVSIDISDGGIELYSDSSADFGNKNLRDEQPLFSKTSSIEMYGRTWQFDIETNQSFRAMHSSSQPTWILVGGLAIDAMLLGLFVFLSRANRAALHYADQMTEQMKEKSVRLERSNHDLEQFSYVASHDLKAPVNSIKQVIGWIEEDCGHLLSDESKEHISLLKNRCQRMTKLLKDLLEYSQVGRTEYASEQVSLDRMCDDIHLLLGSHETFAVIAPKQSILIQRSPLEIVLRNLISNAIKHHDKKSGSIAVTCETSAEGYLIKVLDDGPGIPEEFHAKALEMFQTLKPRDQVEGSGMGLALAKKIVEHHGGTFEIERGREIGACFIIFWPFENHRSTMVA